MPDATGTPTTNFSIPKYNTGTDAPSGKGFNEAMDFVDALLASNATLLGARARLAVRKNSGGSDFIRRRLNLIEGTNVTLTVADDAGSEEVDVTINSVATGGITQVAKAINTTTGYAGAGDLITLPAFTADGTSEYEFRLTFPYVNYPSAVGWLFVLAEGGTDRGTIGQLAVDKGPQAMFARYTPSSGSHTFKVRTNTGDFGSGGGIECGTGVGGAFHPIVFTAYKIVTS
jgi:stage V sporulation protein SpoVS